jgi:hypothetical protein
MVPRNIAANDSVHSGCEAKDASLNPLLTDKKVSNSRCLTGQRQYLVPDAGAGPILFVLTRSPAGAATLAKANADVFAGSLIRNDNLAPDWLRIETDIISALAAGHAKRDHRR